MKINVRHSNHWFGLCILAAAALLMLAACTDDSDDATRRDHQLRLLSVGRTDDGIATRSAEDGSRIYVYITNGASGVSSQGEFTYDGDNTRWNNQGLSVDENKVYYMYGYMPAAVAGSSSIEVPGGESSYADGAVLKLNGLPVFTDQDICVIVGVKRVTDDTDRTITEADDGNYRYASGIASENYLNLLMAHLYTKLEVNFSVDAEYAALRKIHVTKVELTSTYDQTVNATVTLQSGHKGLRGQVDYSDPVDPAPEPLTETAYEYKDGDDVNYLTATPATLAQVYCPHCLYDGSGTRFTIKSTYDVYDSKGNLIREGCTATNKLQVQDMAMIAPGVNFKLSLAVTPTYLYMLSEPDLDNPTVEVKSE